MSYSLQEIQKECERLNLLLVGVKGSYKRKEKVTVRCMCGGERGVAAFSLFSNKFCCKRSSKVGENNPAKGKRPWNKGRNDLSGLLTGRPEGSLNKSEFSEDIKQKYKEARKRITEKGQPWSGFKRPTDGERGDKLYLVLLKSGKYKIGRSYEGASYRKKEVKEILGEWSAKSSVVWSVEATILAEFKEHKTPLQEKSNGRGMTEWFELSLPIDQVKQRIKSLLQQFT